MDSYQYKTPPYDHQKRANLKAWLKQSFAWLMEMGTGKTKVAIDEMCALWELGLIDAVVVLAPKGSYMNWINTEFPTHMPDRVYETASIVEWRAGGGSKAHQQRLVDLIGYVGGLPVLVMNVEALSSGTHGYLFLTKFCSAYSKIAMYVDESTTIRNPTATRTKRVLEISRKTLFRRIMSGFAAPRSPLDLFSQFEFLRPGLLGFSSWFAFRARYAIMQKHRFGGRDVQVVVGYRDVDSLTKRIEPHSFRVTKAECLDLPPKIYSFWEVEMTEEQERIYREVRDSATSALGKMVDCPDCLGATVTQYTDLDGVRHDLFCNRCGGRGSVAEAYVTATAVITQILRMHQVLCGHVTDESGVSHDVPSNRPTELLNVLQEANHKTIIWARYRRDIEQIADKIKKEWDEKSVVEYHGGVDQAGRTEGLERFQNGDADFFLGNAQTGGFGLTLTAARTTVYYSNDHDLEKRLQSEDRPHRIGQQYPHNYVDLLVRGTVEEKIIEALRNKINIGSILMGDAYKEWLI